MLQQVVFGQTVVNILPLPTGFQDSMQFHQVQVLGCARQGGIYSAGNLADRAFLSRQEPQDQHPLYTAEDFAEGGLSLGEQLDLFRKAWFHWFHFTFCLINT